MLIRLIAALVCVCLAAPVARADALFRLRPPSGGLATPATHHPRPVAKRHARAALRHPHLAAVVAPVKALSAPQFEPAPVPNVLISAPRDRESRKLDVTPSLFRAATGYSPAGDGYVYGSSPQGLDDKRNTTIPGVTVSVPFN